MSNGACRAYRNFRISLGRVVSGYVCVCLNIQKEHNVLLADATVAPAARRIIIFTVMLSDAWLSLNNNSFVCLRKPQNKLFANERRLPLKNPAMCVVPRTNGGKTNLWSVK